MPVRPLPQNPNLEHLKYQAKDLLKGLAARDAAAAQRIREFHPQWRGATDAAIFDAKFQLSDAQPANAREYGFASWAKLKRRIEEPKPSDDIRVPHHERIDDPAFRRAVELIDAGNVEALRQHLARHPKQRHLALALASQYGHAEVVRLLLDAGEDPNRFNPVGGHSHSTPLHQAAGNGHLEVVKLLIQGEANPEIEDILFGSTPAGWAAYGGKKDVERYLRELPLHKPKT
jgi:hypothetical protein